VRRGRENTERRGDAVRLRNGETGIRGQTTEGRRQQAALKKESEFRIQETKT